MKGEMTDQKINEAVARKFGWEKVKGPFGNPILGTIHEYGWKKDGKLWQIIPDYCHSIEAAWEIVENRGEFKRDFILMSSYEFPGWCCRLVDKRDEEIIKTEGHGDTAPRAICEAFLALKNA